MARGLPLLGDLDPRSEGSPTGVSKTFIALHSIKFKNIEIYGGAANLLN
jgi:hypothetical protein